MEPYVGAWTSQLLRCAEKRQLQATMIGETKQIGLESEDWIK